MSADPVPDIIVVRLLRFPLDVYQRSTEHFEGLKREFTLLALSEPNELPRRLVELIQTLTAEYSQAVSAADAVREQAIERGETELPELVYEIPRQAVEGTRILARTLDEADEFCRNGSLLLSLATPPESIAFRRWYLGEFIAQASGLDPLPWPEVDQDALVASPALRGDPPPDP